MLRRKAVERILSNDSDGKNDKKVQWNPDKTMYQGTGEITSLYRGIVKPGFRSIHFTVLNTGRAEKCQSLYREYHFIEDR